MAKAKTAKAPGRPAKTLGANEPETSVDKTVAVVEDPKTKRRGVPPGPWNTKIEEDPAVYGNRKGKRVWYAFIAGPKGKELLPRLIRANTKFEAEHYYKGDGMIGAADLRFSDVTETYQEEFKPKPSHDVEAAGSFSDLAGANVEDFQFSPVGAD